MPVYREPFSQLNRQQLKLLIKKTHLYAVKILGNRQGRSPVLDPEDLVMRALEDTMVGADRPGNGAEPKGRLWDPTARSLWAHLRGCIRSYISHYGESSEGIRRVDIKSQPRTIFDDQDLDGEGIDVGDLLTDEITPEDELEAELAALSDGDHNEEIANVLSKAPNAPVVAPMPVAPTNEVTITTGDSDEDMLAQLQAEFA